MLTPQSGSSGVCSLNACGYFTDEDVNGIWCGAMAQATSCLGPSGSWKLFPFSSFGAGGNERSALLQELGRGGGFAGQEVRYEGRYMCSAAFNWAMCGNHIISASISPSVKWGEARERGDLFVLSVNLKM